MVKYKFSGHETFICKQFWLKKGYDFVSDKKQFSDDIAVVDLGVGKNMVMSIRFWMKSFGLIDEDDKLTELAEYIFGDNGVDPYLEDIGTIWLLHYHLIKTNKASIYNLFFNNFRKERFEFTKEQLLHFIKRKVYEENQSNVYNEKTINNDINVLIRNYLKPDLKESKSDIEDDYARLLIDLDLIRKSREKTGGKSIEWHKVESSNRTNLPIQFILFSILDNSKGRENISFRELLSSTDSPGLIFALNKEGLYNKIQQIVEKYDKMTFSETAGNQVFKIDKELKKWEVLNEYYR